MTNSKEYMRDYQNKRRNSLYIEFFGKPLKITLLQLEILNEIFRLCENFNVKNFTELVKNFTENVKNFTISDVKNLTKDDVKNFTECKELDKTSQSSKTANKPDNSRLLSGFGASENGENSASHAGAGGERGGSLNNNALYLKEKNTKKRKEKCENRSEGFSDDFLRFYEFYPRKKCKDQAWKTWRKISSRPALEILVAAVSLEMKTEQWQKDYGDFIPHPSTWLNRKLWLDYSDKQIAAEIARIAARKAEPAQAYQTYAEPQKPPQNADIAQILAKAGITREIWESKLKKAPAEAIQLALDIGLHYMDINTFFGEEKQK